MQEIARNLEMQPRSKSHLIVHTLIASTALALAFLGIRDIKAFADISKNPASTQAQPQLNTTLWAKGFAAPSLESPAWPKWSHEHWVWENSGNETSAAQLVQDYLAHDIPVSALVIDRPWDVTPNTFTPDPNLYPHLGVLIESLHHQNIRVMLWSDSFVNKEAVDFQEGKANGYFVNGGKTVKWWGGKGALLDYENPEAVQWWHQRMDRVLGLGIDGWKLDGSDPYIALAEHKTALGQLWSLFSLLYFDHSSARQSWDRYRSSYYTDFWKYSVQKTGKKLAITARPVDSIQGLGGQYSFAPYEVSFSGWVGDQDGNWNGLRQAIRNMKESAHRGYLSFGSDIAGFRNKDGQNMREPEVFVRWAQLGAFNTVFENGGDGEHRPWMYGPEVEAIYRKFARIHQSLVPYIYSSAAWAYENHGSAYKNVLLERKTSGPQEETENWNYLLGPSLLIATIDNHEQTQSVTLPEGQWIDFFHPEKIYSGPQSISLSKDLETYPVWIRRGAIIPLQDEARLRILAFPKRGEEIFPIYDEKEKGGTVWTQTSSDKITVELGHLKGPVVVDLRDPAGDLKLGSARVTAIEGVQQPLITQEAKRLQIELNLPENASNPIRIEIGLSNP